MLMMALSPTADLCHVEPMAVSVGYLWIRSENASHPTLDLNGLSLRMRWKGRVHLIHRLHSHWWLRDTLSSLGSASPSHPSTTSERRVPTAPSLLIGDYSKLQGCGCSSPWLVAVGEVRCSEGHSGCDQLSEMAWGMVRSCSSSKAVTSRLLQQCIASSISPPRVLSAQSRYSAEKLLSFNRNP